VSCVTRLVLIIYFFLIRKILPLEVLVSRDSFRLVRLLFLTFLDQLRSFDGGSYYPALADPKHPPHLLLSRRETGFIHRARSFKWYVCFGSAPALVVVVFPSWLGLEDFDAESLLRDRAA